MKLYIAIFLLILLVPLSAATSPSLPEKPGTWMGHISENGSRRFHEIDTPGAVDGVIPLDEREYALVGTQEGATQTGAWFRTVSDHEEGSEPVFFAPQAHDIAVMTPGANDSIFLAGKAESEPQDTVWAAKVWSNGSVAFDRTYAEPQYVFTDALATDSGDYMVVGYRQEDGWSTGGLLLRVSASGELERRTLIGPQARGDMLANIFDAGEGYWVTGSRSSTGRNSWVLRLDTGGDVLWDGMLWDGVFGAVDTYHLESTRVRETVGNQLVLLGMTGDDVVSVEKRDADAGVVYRSKVYSSQPGEEMAPKGIVVTGDGLRLLFSNTTGAERGGVYRRQTDYLLFKVEERRNNTSEPSISLLSVFDWPRKIYRLLADGNTSVVVGVNWSDQLREPETNTLQLRRIDAHGREQARYQINSRSLIEQLDGFPSQQDVDQYTSFAIAPHHVSKTEAGYTVVGSYWVEYVEADKQQEEDSTPSPEEETRDRTGGGGVLDALAGWIGSLVSTVSDVLSLFR